MEIYVFEYNNDIKHWIYAPNIEEAVNFYKETTGYSDVDLFNDCFIEPVPKSEWSSQYIIDSHDPEPDSSESYNKSDYYYGFKIVESFEEFALNNDKTSLIATSEL